MQILWNDIKHQCGVAHIMNLSQAWTFPWLHLPAGSPEEPLTAIREHEFHDALKSLISPPSCHLALLITLPLRCTCCFFFAVCSVVGFSVSLSEQASKLFFFSHQPSSRPLRQRCVLICEVCFGDTSAWHHTHTLGIFSSCWVLLRAPSQWNVSCSISNEYGLQTA